MKRMFLLAIVFNLAGLSLWAQKQPMPTPEFNNEINFFNKDSMTLTRLEKGSAKMKSKTRAGGMAGGESGYVLEGGRSPVRLAESNSLSFIFYNGSGSSSTTHQTDSLMKANGMDPALMKNGMDMMNDPSKNTSLYSMNEEKDNRKITVMSYQGMKLFGKSKKESIKYTLSIKKVRDGYYEILVDKPLPKGEYAFVKMDLGSMDGAYSLFAFGID